MTRMMRLYRWRDGLYRIHVATGLAAAVWFLLMALTGILINHQEALGLLDAEVSNRYFPGHYSSDSLTEMTRLSVIVTDLHSGRILGSHGQYLSDLVAFLLILSLLSGYWSNRMKKGLQTASSRQITQAPVASPGDESQLDTSTARPGSRESSESSSSLPSSGRIPAQ